jgi:hypothetical protein
MIMGEHPVNLELSRDPTKPGDVRFNDVNWREFEAALKPMGALVAVSLWNVFSSSSWSSPSLPSSSPSSPSPPSFSQHPDRLASPPSQA